MREAFVDQPDDDLDLPAVVRRKAPARPPQRRTVKPQRRPGMAEQATAFVFGHPRQILAALFLTGCGGAIAWNALALQSSRHPAPLFTTREIAFTPEPPPETATDRFLPPVRPGAELAEPSPAGPNPHAFVPQSAAPDASAVGATTKPVARSPITDMIRNGGQPAPVATPPARAQQPTPAAASPTPRTAARDPIADMIRMGGPVPVPPGNVGRPDPGDTVLAGQRALARLGYSVKVDGVMGAGTRQALERFEQERRLPVTGEFNARTLRELSSASGIAVQ
ncbi:peptidoglycan-binding domain-containing protein [Microvirga terrestris]|uniref:Peptidoglycan-binding protein n=1 Tax=Microvirga terrestris TaxID=2791024 RepID=A0ABS0HP57_9HYPH|nr:peptidoglycan-binding domain-containing protein [Microvirga terrestris]MBF9195265.1 peptidoglycan-binding protein [Microvirga terrestris]